MKMTNYSKMKEEKMIRTKMYKILLQKAYFETGNSLMSYFKYVFLASFLIDFLIGFLINTCYVCFCYFLGRIYYKKGIIFLNNEIGNQFNLLAKQLRRKL